MIPNEKQLYHEKHDGVKATNYFNQNEVNLNPIFSPFTVFTGNLLIPDNIPNQLFFSFDVKALTSIRFAKDDEKTILKLNLVDLQLHIKVIKNPDQYIFEEGLYRNYMVAELVYLEFSRKLELVRKELRYKEWTNLLVTIEKTVSFDQKLKWNLKECYPVIEFGDLNGQLSFQCKIREVQLAKQSQKITSNYEEKAKSENQREFHEGPLDTIPKNEIPSYKNLPEYQSPKPKPDRLYLCHDMEGGYIQDTNKNNPYPKQKNKYCTNMDYQNTYRCLHLAQASIFNYFSHYLVTIPPKHWRRLCKATKTSCLGTFIVETDKIPEEVYLSPYTIQLLVYFCRLYQFDGYLINFEFGIKNVTKLLLPWLEKLVSQIHIAVPGSQIIWYDSIITNGDVSWQNQINQKNLIFYKICDGIFLNYLWDRNKLQNTLNFRIQDKMIYVGSDCFGRGTYAGGGYNTYRAIQTMKKIDNKLNVLAPALFAPCYTYQYDKLNPQTWKINQKCMYRGLYQYKQDIQHKMWQYYQNDKKDGFKWLIEGQWAVTSYELCRRSISIPVKQLQKKLQQQNASQLILTFFTTVAGTAPNFKTFYKVSIELKLDGNVLNSNTTGNQETSEKQRIVELKMSLDFNLIKQGTIFSVIQEGHDLVKWAGFYGSRFKKDQLLVVGYSLDNDWVARYSTQAIQMPYTTFYNLGHGKSFYFKGKQVKESYDFLSDNDPCYTYIMNSPLNVSICYTDAFVGGTSLLVENTQKLKLIEIQPKKQGKICCRVVFKNLEQTQILKLKLTYKRGAETGEANLTGVYNQKLWNISIFQLNLAQPNAENENEKLTLYLETNKSQKYLLGETAVYQKYSKSILPTIEKLTIDISDHSPPVSPVFFDCSVKTSAPCRVFVTYGDSYGCIGWSDGLNGNKVKINNIHASVHGQSLFKIFIYDAKESFLNVFQKNIDIKMLRRQEQVVLI